MKIRIKKFCIFIIFSFCLLNTSYSRSKNDPKVLNGILDLKNYDFDKKGPLTVKGDWTFYWKKFIDPLDLTIRNVLKSGQKIPFPGVWSDLGTSRNSFKKLEPLGYGSFILKVTGIKRNISIGLNLKSFSSSFKMFIIQNQNVYALGGMGQIGTEEETTIPQFGKFIGDFINQDHSFFILIHGANFHYRSGGPFSPLIIGPKEEVRQNFERIKYRSFFTLGIFLIMGINHFGIFFQRKEDKESLWFSTFCLVVVLRFFSLNSYLDVFFSSPSLLSFDLNRKFEFLTFYLGVPAFCEFLRCLFPDFIHKKFTQGFWIISGLFSLVTILTTPFIFSHTLIFYQIIIVFVAIFIFIQLISASVKKDPFARICLVGILIFVFGVFWDILIFIQVISSPEIFIFTSTVFVFIQSHIISKKFSQTYRVAENLNLVLEKKVKERTKEISILLDNLKSSVFSIEKDLDVIPPFSEYSKTLFKKDIEGMNIFEFLFINLKKDRRTYDELYKALRSIFGGDELSFSFVEGNFPLTVTLSDDERPEGKILKISYTPLFNKSNLVERLMLIVEDITEFENYYKEAQLDQLSFNFIKEVLTIENKKNIINQLERSIKIGLDALDDLLSPMSDTYDDHYFLNNYQKNAEQIISNIENLHLLSNKIRIKLADFDYTSLVGEEKYGEKNDHEARGKINYQLEVTEKINDILEYLLMYGNVVKLFSPNDFEFQFPFDTIIHEKIADLKIILMNLFEKTFLVRNVGMINKEKFARMASLARLYPEFERTMMLIQQRAKFISLLLKATGKEDLSKAFSNLAILVKQMPPKNKLNETVLNHNLIMPYKEILKATIKNT